MEFKIEKQVVKVPTAFVVINGIRLSFSAFESSLEALQALDPTKTSRHYPDGIDRDDLRRLLGAANDSHWVKIWEARGVVTSFDYFSEDDYGSHHTHEMIKAGPGYKPFMKAVKVFQSQLQAERAISATKTRRASLKAQLKALDAPAPKRPGHLADSFYDLLFADPTRFATADFSDLGEGV
jgi:hypothetical protein